MLASSLCLLAFQLLAGQRAVGSAAGAGGSAGQRIVGGVHFAPRGPVRLDFSTAANI